MLMNDDKYALLAEGGYAKVFVDDKRKQVIKALGKTVDGFVNYSSIIDLSIHKSFSFQGMAQVTDYKVTDDNILLEMPYYGKPLNKQQVPHEAIPNLVLQLIYTLLQLYHNGIQHMDVKPCNILYDVATNTTTLIDFNIISCEVFKQHGERTWTSSFGTWNYSAPEVVHYARPHDTSVVWSLGIIIAYLYNRYPLPLIYNLSSDTIASREFWKKTLQDLKHRYKEGFQLPKKHIDVMPGYMSSIFVECTRWEPEQRCTLDDVYYRLYNIVHGNRSVITPSIHHYTIKPYLPGTHVRKAVIEQLDGFLSQCNVNHLFSRVVIMFDRAMEVMTGTNTNEVMISCLFLVMMMFGNYVFDRRLYVNRAMDHWYIARDKLPHIQKKIWELCDGLQWQLWERSIESYAYDTTLFKTCITNVTAEYSIDMLVRGI